MNSVGSGIKRYFKNGMCRRRQYYHVRVYRSYWLLSSQGAFDVCMLHSMSKTAVWELVYRLCKVALKAPSSGKCINGLLAVAAPMSPPTPLGAKNQNICIYA
jgi:hypothetical protein